MPASFTLTYDSYAQTRLGTWDSGRVRPFCYRRTGILVGYCRGHIQTQYQWQHQRDIQSLATSMTNNARVQVGLFPVASGVSVQEEAIARLSQPLYTWLSAPCNLARGPTINSARYHVREEALVPELRRRAKYFS